MRAVSSSSISPSACWNSLPVADRDGALPSLPAAVACPVVLTASDRHKPKKTAYGHKTEHQARMRAHIPMLPSCPTRWAGNACIRQWRTPG